MPAAPPAPSRVAPSDHAAWRDVLTGDGAGDLLAAALAADGARLESWAVHQVHARPGAETTVAYDVVASRGGRTASEHLFATSAAARSLGPAVRAGTLEQGVVRLDGDGRTVHVWRHPHDPALPGLAAGSTPFAVAQRLRALDPAVEVEHLETVTYRPLRRAVLRARTRGSGDPATVYVKVVRPSKVQDLVRRHALFAGAGLRGAATAPAVLAWSDDGVVLLAEADGPSVADHLASVPAARRATAVDPAEILRVTAELPRDGVDLPRRPGWADRLDEYVAALPGVHPVDPARLAALAARVGRVVAARGLGPTVTTHGDLHAANLLLIPGTSRVGSVLDVDTLGPGHRVDDLACAVGHLAVLPSLSPGAYDGAEHLLEAWLVAFGRVVDPAVLRARAAAVVVSLAVGAADHELAATWVSLAEELASGGPVAGRRTGRS
ncbi:aminoglycoside phosphotransferase family protein [Isoptericola sp. NEAU-Y5]|uniref:Aminoglycoside phosphotransferase family protein n=1 Tax=Isoptericola luteus TaxID=2879484 RepID=A0ABS7ZCC0_9MICO|nr:phosphotransferase [Isoptericola sp. NEAU-Y5]MCA5892696.1 aminoglycoside phosphotransferase family protein [Isoptericola sp. NEAU-Y5]